MNTPPADTLPRRSMARAIDTGRSTSGLAGLVTGTSGGPCHGSTRPPPHQQRLKLTAPRPQPSQLNAAGVRDVAYTLESIGAGLPCWLWHHQRAELLTGHLLDLARGYAPDINLGDGGARNALLDGVELLKRLWPALWKPRPTTPPRTTPTEPSCTWSIWVEGSTLRVGHNTPTPASWKTTRVPARAFSLTGADVATWRLTERSALRWRPTSGKWGKAHAPLPKGYCSCRLDQHATAPLLTALGALDWLTGGLLAQQLRVSRKGKDTLRVANNIRKFAPTPHQLEALYEEQRRLLRVALGQEVSA